MKICRKCRLDKEDSEFYRSKEGWLKSVCKICHNQTIRANRAKNPGKWKEYRRAHYEANKATIAEQHKAYREAKAEYLKEYKKQPRFKKYRREYAKKRRTVDPVYRIRHSLRSSISRGMKMLNHDKTCSTVEVLGCSFADFKLYIESKWECWMSWENYGLFNGTSDYGWDLDHIIPLDTAFNEMEIKELNHYTNFQPLCSFHNRIIKRANI